MKIPVIALVVVSTMPMFAASPPAKPAWQWTVDERLAARFDEAARARRVDDYMAARVARQSGRSAQGLPVATARPTDAVHGSSHPELLLPHEIFMTFTRAAYQREDDTARTIREDAARRAVPLGLPVDFLASWQETAHRFITLQREELQLRRALNTGTSTQPQHDTVRIRELAVLECRSRAAAMRDLRAKFGTSFDRFLYEVAAQNVFRDIYEPVSAQKLRAEEEGCR